MKIELSRRDGIILGVVIAAIGGVIWGSLLPFGSSYRPELSVSRDNLTIEKAQNVSAQSLGEGTSASYGFPPPLYVFEWTEFEVNVRNASGGILEISFTRNGWILRRELVYGPEKIVVSGYGEYRLRTSDLDVTLRAINDDVSIRSLHVSIRRGVREYNPLVSVASFTLSVGITIILLYKTKRTASRSQVTSRLLLEPPASMS